MMTAEQAPSVTDWLDSAAAQAAAGNPAAACQHLQQAIDAAPGDGQVLLAAGHICLAMRDFEGALGHYAAAALALPEIAVCHSSQALALQLLNRPDQAAAKAVAALALDPQDLVSLKVLARIHLNQSQHEKARTCCRRILDQNPADPEGLAMLAQCRFNVEEITGKGFAPQAGTVQIQRQPAGRSDAELKQLLEKLLNEEGFRRLQRLGFHLQRNDYYSPLNDCDQLEASRDLWQNQGIPADIDWCLNDQLEVAAEVSRYVGELSDVPVHPPEDCSAFAWKNNFWENADAVVQYGLVRSRRSARYVEIGCGWSSLLLKKALERNAAEGSPTAVTLIEPYPNLKLFQHFPSDWNFHRCPIQRAPFHIFDSLEAGDVLFYDGSHCSKVGSDVNWFFFQILPRLKPGVIIHIHDISLPNEYPEPWIFERGQTWNEQYVLQAFLMNNRDYKILIANRYIFTQRAKELERLYGSKQPVYGSSFWMQKLNPSPLASPGT